MLNTNIKYSCLLFIFIYNSFEVISQEKPHSEKINISITEAVYLNFYDDIKSFHCSAPESYVYTKINENDKKQFIIQALKRDAMINKFTLSISLNDNNRYFFILKTELDISQIFYVFANKKKQLNTVLKKDTLSKSTKTLEKDKSTSGEINIMEDKFNQNKELRLKKSIINKIKKSKRNIFLEQKAITGIIIKLNKVYTYEDKLIINLNIINTSNISYQYYGVNSITGYLDNKKETSQETFIDNIGVSTSNYKVGAKEDINLIIMYNKLILNKNQYLILLITEKTGKRDIKINIPYNVINNPQLLK